jgi:hypothetical protein
VLVVCDGKDVDWSTLGNVAVPVSITDADGNEVLKAVAVPVSITGCGRQRGFEGFDYNEDFTTEMT